MVDLKIDPLDENRIKARLGAMRQKSGIVMARAVKRGKEKGTTLLKREIAKLYRFTKQSEIAKAVKKTGNPTAENPSATLLVSASNVPLYKFSSGGSAVTVDKVRGKKGKRLKRKKGEKARRENAMKRIRQKLKGKVRKDSSGAELTGDQDYSKAFVAKMSNGHTGLFQRKFGEERGSARTGRKQDEKITQLQAVSVAAMAMNRKVSEEVLKGAAEEIGKRLEHEIQRVMQGQG